MARSQNSFIKKLKAEKKAKKRQEKFKKKLEKKDKSTSGDLEDMMAYVDEFGNITSKPTDEEPEQENKKTQTNNNNNNEKRNS